MRIPLAPAGRREIYLITLLFGGVTTTALVLALAGYRWFWPVAVLFGLFWALGIAFFRDPERSVPGDADVMVSPADGKVTEVVELDHHETIDGPALRISIFLSVFSVHVNRSPCAGVVRSCCYQPGRFLDARLPECASCNEANTVVLDTAYGPVIVRQIAGKIARRIVCSIRPGEHVAAGQRIGLIKFGSRTELILPRDKFQPTVTVGDAARGAVTILARRVTADVADDRAAAPARGS